MIYKEFDTSLTKVKGPVNRLPHLKQTTNQRPDDMIRDRLLSFNVKNGQVVKGAHHVNRPPRTMKERSELLARKKKEEEQMSAKKLRLKS